MIEALLAAAIFLMVVIGILPLFIRSSISNLAGRESTNVSNETRSRAEELFELAFNSAPLTITAGTENVVVDYLVEGDADWTATPDPTKRELFRRTTTIRQYSVVALRDGVLTPDEALPAASPPDVVDLKEIQVQVVASRAAGAFGPQKSVTIRLLKAK
ncbi:MAG: hypothetical protein R3325_06610 [Thermoanaerobaculia bacterium]|nr:hypothetical protein [Thermoanaerobaculia bacterium]